MRLHVTMDAARIADSESWYQHPVCHPLEKRYLKFSIPQA